MPAERKPRAPNLDGRRLSRAVVVIRSMEQAPTWVGIIEALWVEFGVGYTRQALASHRSIVAAYEARRSGCDEPQAGRASSATARLREERARTREVGFARLKSQNEALNEQMRRFAYNAYAHGLDEATLNQQLPGKIGHEGPPTKRRKARQWRYRQADGHRAIRHF